MITTKQAIDYAKQSLQDVYGDIAGGQVEEYALDGQRQHWLITLSFPVFSPDTESLASLIPERKWKTFSVNTETGEVEAMLVGGAGELVSQ